MTVQMQLMTPEPATANRLAEDKVLAFIPDSVATNIVDDEFLLKTVLIAYLNRSFREYRTRLYNYLVGVTARQAYLHSPFYMRRFAPFVDMIEGRASFDLARLPILTRDDVEQAGSDLLVPGHGQLPSYTSGTTSGRSLMLLHSCEGKRVLNKVLNAFDASLSPKRRRTGSILKLAFQALGNEGSGEGGIFPVISKLHAGMEKALDLLAQSAAGVEEMLIHTISGNPYDIVDLTICAIKRFGADFPRITHNIEELHTTGTYVSSHLRTWLEETWGASLYDALSFSELPAFAVSCKLCGHYHFHPFCFVEVADQQGNVLPAGRGRLIVTALYPTVQATHLIRYEVGDFVERICVNCPNGEDGYRFLGRYNGSVLLRPEQAEAEFLGICEVIDILDDFPDLNRPVLKHNVGYEEPLRDFKHWPLIEISNPGAGRPLTLAIELRYPPAAFPARCREIEAEVRTRFRERLPWFKIGMDAEQFRIRFENPRRFVL